MDKLRKKPHIKLHADGSVSLKDCFECLIYQEPTPWFLKRFARHLFVHNNGYGFIQRHPKYPRY